MFSKQNVLKSFQFIDVIHLEILIDLPDTISMLKIK